MADNPAVYSGSDGTAITVATDEVGGAQHQLVIVEWGPPDTATRVSLADPLPVQGTVTANAGTGPWPVTDNGGSLTVDGTVAATQSGTWNVGAVTSVTNVVHVDDNSGSLTVDAASWPLPTGAATAAKQVSANSGTAFVAADPGTPGLAVRQDSNFAPFSGVDDGDYTPLQVDQYGYLKVNVTAADSYVSTVAADVTYPTLDYSSGQAIGITGAVRKDTATDLAGGNSKWAALQMNSTGSLRVDGSGATQPVSVAAVVHVDDNSSTLSIDDGGGSITVDGTVTVGTITSITNVVHVDDNSGSLTVDGSVTANAGTNLNTSALALDATLTGGTQKSKLVDTGGTNVASVSAAGRLSVDASGVAVPITDNSGSITVDNAGTFAVQATNATATNLKAQAEVYQGGTAVSSSAPLEVNVRSVTGTAIPITDNSGSLTVDQPTGTNLHMVVDSGTVTTVSTVSTVTNVVHVDDNSGSLTVDAPVGTPAFVRLSDGASAITTLPVSLASLPSGAVTNAGTFAVQAEGNTAEDNALAGNPVRMGVRASSTLPSAMSTNGDVVTPWADKSGTLIIGARASSSQPSTITDANGAPLWMTQRGALVIQPSAIMATSAVTPTISTAAYVAGDQLHSSTSMTFNSLTGASGRPIQVVGATLMDKSSQNAATELWLFTSGPTLVNANANDVFDITDANLASNTPVLIIDFAAANYHGTASNSMCMGTWIGGQPIQNSPTIQLAATTLSGVLVTRGTPTYAGTTDLIVSITCLQL